MVQEADSTAVDELARAVSRVEALREVKDVQRAYAQLSQFGRWTDMAQLFATDGVLRWGEETVTGRAAIADWLRERAGAMDGATPGTLHTEVIDQPLVNLSVDGRTAKGRWGGIAFLGDGAGRAWIEAGVHENSYVVEDGRWKIAELGFHPQFEGDYTEGWTNVGGAELPIVPAHFTLDESGVPVPEPSGPPPRSGAGVAELAGRIRRLNDEDAVRNLQHAYGYYVDRTMWSDVVDLFADGAVLRIDGVEHRGAAAIRAALEDMGAEDLSDGELNDYPIFDLIVDVRGTEAVARGIEIGMLTRPGADTPVGVWEFAVFRNRFVNQDGLWKLTEVCVERLMRADYDKGWGNGGTLVRTDRPVPEFLGGTRVSARRDSRGPRESRVGAPRVPPDADLADLRRRLARSQAFDGTENVSSAYGFYIDDFQWPEMAGTFAVNGHKSSPFAGFYLGRDRILGAVNAFYGGARAADATRVRISFHWRTQPVIHVSHDGRSATLRTRLFQPRTAMTVTPGFTGFNSGMYPNDQTVLEDGIWRLWSLTIDESYFVSPGWKGGWAAVQARPEGAPNPPPSRLLQIYPPDVLLTDLGERQAGFRGGGGTTIEWPGILPMWFHYRNPVSGRTPKRYWPDCVPAELRPDTRMTAHGYQMPPSGPSVDGVDV